MSIKKITKKGVTNSLPFFLIILITLFSTIDSYGQMLTSPDGQIVLNVENSNGQITYSIFKNDETLILPSHVGGFEFKNQAPLGHHLKISDFSETSFDETWKTVWGSYSEIRNKYNELLLHVDETKAPFRKVDLTFRVYNDGVGFRYNFPEQENMGEFQIVAENTEFNLAENFTAWWQAANWNSYENSYVKTSVSDLGNLNITPEHHGKDYWGGFGAETITYGYANTPVTLETTAGTYLSIHEADLTVYAGMTLKNMGNNSLKSSLVPWPDGEIKVKGETPHATPWRTIQIGDNAGDLIESNLLLNLNDPPAYSDTEWIKPAKYGGVWWELHIGHTSWGGVGKTHGANTENVKMHIDFAAENGIDHVLVEGWVKRGPLSSEGGGDEGIDLITPADDFDFDHIVRYAAEKGVHFMPYNETAGHVNQYRDNFDEIFSFYQENNIKAIKAGHVDDRMEETYHKHSQFAVQYFDDLLKKTAQYEIMLQVHEPVKPTGRERTYPHYMTREGVGGTEQDKFEHTDPRTHTTIIPFTRMLGGPVDYMPGVFDLELDGYPPAHWDSRNFRVQNTIARQLAYYPIFLSGLQAVVDLPHNYEGNPAFQFIRDVPVTWDNTVVLEGEIGEYISIARRKGDEWYVGAITNDQPRTLTIMLDFLGEGDYEATIYADGADAHSVDNPTSVEISTTIVSNKDSLQVVMANGGGQAIRFSPVE